MVNLLAVVTAALFTFNVTPDRCIKPCEVTLKFEIIGDICPTEIQWIFDDGYYGDAKAERVETVEECGRNVYFEHRWYGPGLHRVGLGLKFKEGITIRPMYRKVEVR